MKKIIILQHNGGRLGNQLWNYISVYAFCLEKKYLCQNYSFYKYEKYFNIKNKNLLYKTILLSYRLAALIGRERYFGKFYNKYVKLIAKLRNNKIIYSCKNTGGNGVFYLLSAEADSPEQLKLADRAGDKLYLVYRPGCPFRNPIGIKKYRPEIKKYFLPKEYIRRPVENFIDSLRKKYKYVIGVHIRQDDYRGKFMAGGLYFNESQTVEILRQYLSFFNRSAATTCFLLCSDGPVNLEIFKGLVTAITEPAGVMEDLYALSLTDVIIGSDSTFSSFASYYGDIPHIIFDKNGVDWQYYKDKNKYFINKYSTVTKLN